MTNEKELLPCPFVNGCKLKITDDGMYVHHIPNCLCPLEEFLCDINLWNKRATPTLIPLDESEVAQHLLFMFFSNHPDLKSEALRISKIICSKYGHPARKEISVEDIFEVVFNARMNNEPYLKSNDLAISEAIKQYIDGKE